MKGTASLSDAASVAVDAKACTDFTSMLLLVCHIDGAFDCPAVRLTPIKANFVCMQR